MAPKGVAMPPVGVMLPAALGLVGVHVLAGKLRFLHVVPRSRTLSVAGGVSVAYVFVHLLPEITERQSELAASADHPNRILVTMNESLLFLVALAGFVAFYGLERYVVRSRRDDAAEEAAGAETRTPGEAFWVHVGTFVAYNGLVGYLLLHREESGVANLLLYAVAMALHLLVNDYSLRDHHREAYETIGRWLLAAGVLIGVGIGLLVPVPGAVVDVLVAFLGGAVILNVVKEELPEERESRFWAFGLGVGGYAIVLLAL